MKTVTFADKTTLTVEDISTATEMVVKTTTDKIGAAIAQVTKANLATVEVGEDKAANLIPTNITMTYDGETVEAHFFNRYKTNEEILNEQVAELQEAVAALTGTE